MRLYRYDGDRAATVDLSGVYRGCTAFLVGGSPTLLSQDFRRLEAPGVLTFGMNNVGRVVKCRNCVFADRPACYYGDVLRDPSVVKFAKHVFNGEDAGGTKWRDLPSTLFYNQRLGLPSADDVSGDTVVAGNNVLAVSVFLLLSFGVRRIVLCGCSFESGSYSDGRTLDDDGYRWNAKLYSQQVEWLSSMRPTFESCGVELVDTSVRSKLSDRFETMPLARAVEAYSVKRDDGSGAVHCLMTGDRGGREIPDAPRDDLSDISVFTGLKLDGRHSYESGVRMLMLAAMLHSLSRTNPGIALTFLADLRDDDMSLVRRVSSSVAAGLNVRFVKFSEETRAKFPKHAYLTYMSCVRCFLHELFPKVGRCVWLDTDLTVRESLRMLVREGDAFAARGMPLSGAPDYGFTGTYFNSGVLYMNLDLIRRGGHGDLMERKCAEFVASENSEERHLADQHAANLVPHGMLSKRWNVQLAPFEKVEATPDMEELYRTASVYHYSGPKHSCIRLDNPITDSLFEELALVRERLSPSDFYALFDFEYSFHWKNKLNRFLNRGSEDAEP